ncbi:hypothetical protein BpHYR1_023115 [Brachionus plicatilis]|uniref:Uncharacterized protein n=1 Tax=Brachionus plicatilis TaxID=10195 RepID=A0A3M7SAR8_BRAPC|nr:hypothetical protein BpHYR1_023115 [Brachionus plicatilis]
MNFYFFMERGGPREVWNVEQLQHFVETFQELNFIRLKGLTIISANTSRALRIVENTDDFTLNKMAPPIFVEKKF